MCQLQHVRPSVSVVLFARVSVGDGVSRCVTVITGQKHLFLVKHVFKLR